MQQHQIILSILGTLAWSGFFLLGHSNVSESHSSSSSSNLSDHDDDHNRRSLRISDFIDPKSLDQKADTPPDPPDSWFDELKFAEPSIALHRPDSANLDNVVVDVLAIGCESKFDYMTAQANNWASDVRYFWGFTEREDFDRSCAAMDEETMASYIQTCRTSTLGTSRFGVGHKPTESGWFCAQRRPGRALGWLQAMYQVRDSPPDILILVDDDTSVDIDKVKKVLQTKNQEIPFIGAGSVFSLGKYDGFSAPHGGFGTWFNKAAILEMTQPIFCDERQNESEFMRNACTKLQKNRAGEVDFFQQGDSVFDIFYKHSAHQKFCMHSDWGIGYMITNYSESELEQVVPQSRRGWCDEESVSCHYQKPNTMEEFVIAHPQMK